MSHQLSKVRDHIPNHTDIKKLWMGKDDAFVAVLMNGAVKWNLGNRQYPGLADKLGRQTTEPLVSAASYSPRIRY